MAPPERPDLPPVPSPSAWDRYPAGRHFLAHVSGGGAPAASWLALPSSTPAGDWPAALAEAARATLDGGRGSVIVVPDHRDVARVDAALTEVLGPGRHVRLTADQGPQARYTAWLKVLRGHVQVVVGTRAAGFAPVRDLGLLAWWDDGDDLHEEPRAPYPHVREVLAARARLEGAALLSGGFARTTPVQAWVESGELKPIEAAPHHGPCQRAQSARCGGGDRARARPCRGERAPALAGVADGQAGAGPRAGPGAGPAARVPAVAVLPDLPRACPVHALQRPAGASRAGCGTGLPLVRQGDRRLRVLALRRTPAPVLGRRGPAHRRGARAGVPRRAGAHVGFWRRARPRGWCAEPGHRHPGRRAGRRGRLCRRAAARRVGQPRPPRPDRGGGVCAPLAGRGSARQGSGGSGCRRAVWSTHPHHDSRGRGPGAVGPGVVRRARAGRAPGAAAALPPCAWPP